MELIVARACIKDLARSGGGHVIEPGDSQLEFADNLLSGLVSFVPGGPAVLTPVKKFIEAALENVSLTIPTPLGTTIVFSKNAVATGSEYFDTGMHELVHLSQIAHLGATQATFDWVGSSKLRGFREAEAASVGLWAKFVVTGRRPDPESASVLTSSLYHLDPPSLELAREVVLSVLGTIDSGATPPFAIASQMLVWLRANSPESIMVSDYRSR